MSSDVPVLGDLALAGNWRAGRRPTIDRASALLRRVVGEARAARHAAECICNEAARLRSEADRNKLESIRLTWRARQLRFDRLGPIVAMWAGDESETSISDLVGAESSVDLRQRDSLEEAISRLFSITVDISSALTMNGEPELARRLKQILDKTDAVIRDLRMAASKAEDAVEKPIRDHSHRRLQVQVHSTEDVHSRDLAAALLDEAIHTIDRLARFARDNSQTATVDLQQASHAAHRALVSLAPPAAESF